MVADANHKDCEELIAYYLEHPGEAAAIAQAGQRRTLREHTYQCRMIELESILERHLRHAETGEVSISYVR